MSVVREFFDLFRENIRSRGVKSIAPTATSSFEYVVKEAEYHASHKWNAMNIYDREWDMLVLLDCATIGMMETVRSEFDFLREIECHVSPGTSSGEWMKRTFTESFREEMAQTLHVTANTASDEHLRPDTFLRLEEVWKAGWNEEMGTIPARKVTDCTIYLSRKYDSDRTIVHYMQPHLPFVNSDIESNHVTPAGIKGRGLSLGGLHRQKGYSRKELWNASLDNLRYVLNDVELLLSNVDADQVVISSDHGQAFGEKGVWGHPYSTFIDVLTNVPWCVTSASDTGEYRPEYTPDQDIQNTRVEEKIAALGYK